MVPNGDKWYQMVPNVCGLGKWQLEIKEKSKLRQILQFCPPLSDFTHLVVPRTCSKRSQGMSVKARGLICWSLSIYLLHFNPVKTDFTKPIKISRLDIVLNSFDNTSHKLGLKVRMLARVNVYASVSF